MEVWEVLAVRVLYVCTANICRSPSAAALLRDAVSTHPELGGIEVQSAGTHAWDGAPGCGEAPALAGRAESHRSQTLTAELVAWADLVLTAERDHRAAIVSLDPAARSRTFTMIQGGLIADWLVGSGMVEAARAPGRLHHLNEGDPRGRVGLLPEDRSERWRWVVEELDAGRGLARAEEAPPQGTRGRWRRARSAPPPIHSDDVPDPHVLGTHLHESAYDLIYRSTEQLVVLLLDATA